MLTTTTTFKTNLNSVSNGCTLAALKEHITTCLQRWRQKHLSIKRSKPQEHQPEDCYCHCKQNFCRWFKKTSNKEYPFVQRTTVYCKSINTKFKKLIKAQQQAGKKNSTIHEESEGPRKYGRKVEIVAKLLSTTLIARTSATSEDFGQQRDNNICRSLEEQLKVIQNSTTALSTYHDTMTISDLTFLEIRNEYPDLDSEIRSILTARAQDGATISEIRDDYRKLTGVIFPIYENITEFLLTIPYVSAYCNEKRTRIFNVRPMNETKHVHDMVMHQKSQQEPVQKPMRNRYWYRQRERNINHQPYNWRLNTSRRLQQNSEDIYAERAIMNDNEQQRQQIAATTDSNLSRDESEGFFESNCYYRDNCNYLFNRICNQKSSSLYCSPHMEQAKLLPKSHMEQAKLLQKPLETQTANNCSVDITSYKNNINNFNNLLQLQQQQQQQQQQRQQQHQNQHLYRPRQQEQHQESQHNINNLEKLPKSSRSSSPTAKSCYTNDSAFTDSDYEAHLLDFLLLGDDFFLYMARMELRCKFKKNQQVLQSGLCVSGQTVRDSIKRIMALNDDQRSIIVNIGSVDIMRGRKLIQIEHDFRELITTMLNKGIKPILTTLAPLANYIHNSEIKDMLERFNEFIKREGQKRNLVVIDIWQCLVNKKGHVFFDCYQNEPRNVTGTCEPYLFWNKIGRQRVLQLIESNLEY